MGDIEGILMVNDYIRKRIKELREKRGFSLGALSQKAGISKSALYGIEEGKVNPTINSIWAIANALDIPFGELTQENMEINQGSSHVTLVDKRKHIEVYKTVIKDDASVVSPPHMPHTVEEIQIVDGEAMVGELSNPRYLRTGDHYRFKADVPHIYKALGRQVVMIVTLKYPERKDRYFNEDRFWNEYERKHLEDIDQEIENGMEMIRVFLQNPDLKLENHYSTICNRIVTPQRGVYFCPVFRGVDGSVRELMHRLELLDLERYFSSKSGQSPSLLELSLETEDLLKRGTPRVHETFLKEFESTLSDAPKHTSFERRISVGLYGIFEYFHPGYAVQALLLGGVLAKYADKGEKVLDIGTGPGQHLRLLSELVPSLKFDVIEPSTIASRFLEDLDNIASLHTVNLSKFKGEQTYRTVISVGASHHMPLSEFFDNAYRVLEPDGVFIVCDEYIAPFKDQLERDRNLILHHTQYMIETMVPIEGELSKIERSIYEGIRTEITYARYAALQGDTHEARRCVVDLFDSIRSLPALNELSDPLMAYYLFVILELEALVAGLDYEEERKSSYENFLLKARDHGFRVESGGCFHPTTSRSGTYLSVLRKDRPLRLFSPSAKTGS